MTEVEGLSAACTARDRAWHSPGMKFRGDTSVPIDSAVGGSTVGRDFVGPGFPAPERAGFFLCILKRRTARHIAAPEIMK